MNATIRWAFASLSLLVLLLAPRAAPAQETAWLQIEARSTLALAEERARAYARELDNVNGFRLRSGWYAIVLGPYPADLAAAELGRLRAIGAVPRDSFVADGAGYRDRFWPVGAGPITAAPLATPTGRAAPETAPEPAGETVAEARAAERSLSRSEREEVQRSLQTLGFYSARIDGAFGPGTRRAMAEWQAANGHEATGVMTTAQRRELVEGLREAVASLGMERVVDQRAGIEIDLPLDHVTFEGYEAPFVRYEGAKAQVLLISQSGDLDTLRGLYDVMQTLAIVPLDGARQIGRGRFTLIGENDEIVSYTYAAMEDGAVKGFTLVWPQGDDLRRRLAVERMLASFRPISGAVLPDTAGDRDLQRPDLLAGLQIRQPDASVSGFYVSADGDAVTVASAVSNCGRITLGDVEAELAATDEGLGLALLSPTAPLAPLAVGRLSAVVPRLQAEIAVAGYSYGGTLGAPTISFGTLEDLRGLDGEERLARLALSAQPGDAGGPVLDAGGGVLGMLLPRNGERDRSLPPEVQFAADAEAIAAFLAANGIDLASVGESPELAPEDLALVGADITALVECWN